MGKRCTPVLECLEARQVLNASLPAAGTPFPRLPEPAEAVAASNPAPAEAPISQNAEWADVAPLISEQPTAPPPAAEVAVAEGDGPARVSPPPEGVRGGLAPTGQEDPVPRAEEDGLSTDAPPSPMTPGRAPHAEPPEEFVPKRTVKAPARPRAGFAKGLLGHPDASGAGDLRPSKRLIPAGEGDRPKDSSALGWAPDSPSDPPPRAELAPRKRDRLPPPLSDGLAEGAPLSGSSLSASDSRQLGGPPPPEGGPRPGGASPTGVAPAHLDPRALQVLFQGLWEAPSGEGLPLALLRSPDQRQPGVAGEEVYFPPLWLAVLRQPTGQPLDPVERGYLYLCQYARSAIHAAERRVGPLRDPEDIVQQVCVEWLEKVGPPAEAFARLLEHAPAEMRLLREVVSRVIARAVYHQKKQWIAIDFTDWPAPVNTAERDWAEFQADCEQGVGHLTRREWQVLELRRQGRTFAEIGSELRLPRQRVWEIYHGVEARLQKIYGGKDG